MWFDVQSALKEILNNSPAVGPADCDSRDSRDSLGHESQESQESQHRQSPQSGSVSPQAKKLPTHPPICASCGVGDWTVAVTDENGRKLHVPCWKREQE